MAKVYIPVKVDNWDGVPDFKRAARDILGVSVETLVSSELMVTIIGTQGSVASAIDRIQNLVGLRSGLRFGVSMPVSFYRVFDGEDDEIPSG